jgi:hypothetical protein
MQLLSANVFYGEPLRPRVEKEKQLGELLARRSKQTKFAVSAERG